MIKTIGLLWKKSPVVRQFNDFSPPYYSSHIIRITIVCLFRHNTNKLKICFVDKIIRVVKINFNLIQSVLFRFAVHETYVMKATSINTDIRNETANLKIRYLLIDLPYQPNHFKSHYTITINYLASYYHYKKEYTLKTNYYCKLRVHWGKCLCSMLHEI